MFKRPHLQSGKKGRLDNGLIWYSNDTLICLWELERVEADRSRLIASGRYPSRTWYRRRRARAAGKPVTHEDPEKAGDASCTPFSLLQVHTTKPGLRLSPESGGRGRS